MHSASCTELAGQACLYVVQCHSMMGALQRRTSPIRAARSVCALLMSSLRLCRLSICENALATNKAKPGS